LSGVALPLGVTFHISVPLSTNRFPEASVVIRLLASQPPDTSDTSPVAATRRIVRSPRSITYRLPLLSSARSLGSVKRAFSSTLNPVACVPLPVLPSPDCELELLELDELPLLLLLLLPPVPVLPAAGGVVVPVSGGVELVLPEFEDDVLPVVVPPVAAGVVVAGGALLVVSLPVAVVAAGTGEEDAAVEPPPPPPHAAINRERKKAALFLVREDMVEDLNNIAVAP
jgi:hypothetical protein